MVFGSPRSFAPRRVAAHSAGRTLVTCLLVALAACTPTRFETTADLPLPLIDKIPVVVGVHLPLEFREKVYEEKRERGGEYSIGLGKAQSAGFMRIVTAMFNRVVVVDSPAAAAAADKEIRGVLQPTLDDYAFVTPADVSDNVPMRDLL